MYVRLMSRKQAAWIAEGRSPSWSASQRRRKSVRWLESAVPTTLGAGVRRTLNKVDKRGKLLEQSNLGVTHLDGSTTGQLVRQTYDAWGNTLAATTSLTTTTTAFSLL